MYPSSLLLLIAVPLMVVGSPIIAERQTVGSIDAAFKAKGKKYVGVATDQGRFSVSQNAAIIKNYMGQVTPENSMKWDAIECEFSYSSRVWRIY